MNKEIICTLGPISSVPDVLLEMGRAGMSVLRINCSHYEPKTAVPIIAFVRKHHPQVRILVDLQGPRLRVASRFPEKSAREGQIVQFVGEVNFISARRKDAFVIPLSLSRPFGDFENATTVHMKDGTMVFDVIENRAKDGYVLAKTRWGGVVRGEKAINVPGLPLPASALTDKDRVDLRFAAEVNADAVMLSFVNRAADIQELVGAWEKLKPARKPAVWAKIETSEGIKQVPAICQVTDAILIGRGDLAAEVGFLEAPAAQSQLIEAARKASKPCYIATQVLESMRANPYPARSEMRDIYVSLREGATGFMLTAETSVGKYPIPAIEILRDMIRRHATETSPPASGKVRKAKSPAK